MKTEGAYMLQYHGPSGWYTGHHGADLRDPAKYVAKAAANGTKARAIDKETGQIYGAPCALCGDAHEGVDGSCLL